MSTFTRSGSRFKYIYDLPFVERSELCKILNQHDKWEELAGKWMQYDVLTIQNLRKEKNPTDELLTLWGHHNHTILELFVLLSRMKHYQSMTLLIPFVDKKYHCLLNKGINNIENILDEREPLINIKDLKIGTQNFNKSISPQPNIPKVVIDASTKEASYKILNQPVGIVQIAVNPSNSNNLLVPSPVAARHLSPLHNNVNQVPSSSLAAPVPEATLPRVPYAELGIATDNWNKHNILGKGGFGIVYKGTWKNTDVAIKRIERRGADSNESYMVQLQQSLKEIEILNSRPHENILPLYAYCLDGREPCLVYQLMRNGSLEDKLFSKQKNQSPLSWMQRHEIAKGTARGLQYLHTIGKKPLIHGDIKSANILLDKNYEPKIGDFGLAKEGPEKDSLKVSKIHGTRPYLPDDFLYNRQLSTKVDTYSYGIVLFELATGLPAYDDSRPQRKFLKDFIDGLEDDDLPFLIDQKAGEKDKQVYSNFIVLGKWCANQMAQNRPEMELVFRKLNDL